MEAYCRCQTRVFVLRNSLKCPREGIYGTSVADSFGWQETFGTTLDKGWIYLLTSLRFWKSPCTSQTTSSLLTGKYIHLFASGFTDFTETSPNSSAVFLCPVQGRDVSKGRGGTTRAVVPLRLCRPLGLVLF